MAKTLTPAELWILELERERHDTSWRYPAPKQSNEPQVIFVPEKIDRKKQKHRDNVMFHAGRYSAGARDKAAISANQEIASLLKGK